MLFQREVRQSTQCNTSDDSSQQVTCSLALQLPGSSYYCANCDGLIQKARFQNLSSYELKTEMMIGMLKKDLVKSEGNILLKVVCFLVF